MTRGIFNFLVLGRFATTRRTLQRAYRNQFRAQMRRPTPLIAAGQSEVVGYLEEIAISEGNITVRGWSFKPRLAITTDCATSDVDADIQRDDIPPERLGKGFQVSLPGTTRVTIGGEGVKSATWRFDGYLKRVRAAARLVAVLFGIALNAPRDVCRYLVRGDALAGERLEARLLPRPAQTTRPIAPVGLFETQPLPTHVEPVDIIVPVFNAYDDVVVCLARLAAHTEPQHRVILVDDASTDGRIAPLLAAFIRDRQASEIITHPSNQGFIAAVNAGLARTQGHVVLVNTDAFVPAHWLSRLMAPILSNPTVASVTPMSNNAEIAGAPIISANWICADGDAVRADQNLARLGPFAQANAPTGVGFCMALSRRFLAKLPTFDTAFGKGYGEEVDWCQKAAERGCRHVIVGNLFVEHRGGASFGPEKLDRLRQNNARISRRYPHFDESVVAFKRADPLIGPRLVAGLGLIAGQGDVPIYLAHRLGGGATHWLNEQIALHHANGQSAVVLRDGDIAGTVLVELHTPLGTTIGNIPLAELSSYLVVVPRKQLIYSCLVAARDPVGLLQRAIDCLGQGDRLRILFHDFFPLCPSYNLLNAAGEFCHLPEKRACESCFAALSRLAGPGPTTITGWRSAWSTAMLRANEISVFSQDSRRHVLTVWPELADKISVAPHQPTWLPEPVQQTAGRPVIGVLGDIGYSKGAAILYDLATSLGKIVIIGTIAAPWRHPRMIVHGTYKRDEITALAKRYQITQWLIPAIWPETFSYTVHECLATRLPVYTFDLGAQAEAARGSTNGIVLPLGLTPAALHDALRLQSHHRNPTVSQQATVLAG